jgi:exosortase/archaeosortase
MFEILLLSCLINILFKTHRLWEILAEIRNVPIVKFIVQYELSGRSIQIIFTCCTREVLTVINKAVNNYLNNSCIITHREFFV